MTGWQRSSFCSGGDCMEAQADPDRPGLVWVRSSTDLAAEFWVTRAEFAAFLLGARNGDFDHLVAETPL